MAAMKVLGVFRMRLGADFAVCRPCPSKKPNFWPIENHIEIAKRLQEAGKNVVFCLESNELEQIKLVEKESS